MNGNRSLGSVRASTLVKIDEKREEEVEETLKTGGRTKECQRARPDSKVYALVLVLIGAGASRTRAYDRNFQAEANL